MSDDEISSDKWIEFCSTVHQSKYDYCPFCYSDYLQAERDRLAAELARARQQAKFWHDKADKRGDELKAIYSQQSKEAKCEKQS